MFKCGLDTHFVFEKSSFSYSFKTILFRKTMFSTVETTFQCVIIETDYKQTTNLPKI